MHQRSECLVRTVKPQGPPARRQPSAALLDLDRGADMGLLPCHPGGSTGRCPQMLPTFLAL